MTRKLSNKVNVAIIGTGNIGSDLLVKVQRSHFLTCSLFTGQNSDSPGIQRAMRMGIHTSADSIEAIVDDPGCCDIVFDATSAKSHPAHAKILQKLGKFTIDMTPSRYGIMCVPMINLEEGLRASNVNMISCGGQATTPIIAAIMRVHPEADYVEIVSSIASKSAGIGTRDNIDEYTQTTCDAIERLGGASKAKAIVILNPADPPILMHNTIFARIVKPNMPALEKAVRKTVAAIRTYVPGFKLTLGPIFENNRVTIMSEVKGLGDYLPVYAGNLDIINCAAMEVAQHYAHRKLHKSV